MKINFRVMKNILVTGANGFIGSSLVNELNKSEYNVTALIRKNSNTELLSTQSNIRYIDYDDQKELQKIFEDHHILVHCAALTRAKKWKDFLEINVELTQKMVELFNRTDAMQHFIFLSSQAAAGPASCLSDPKKEADNEEPLTNYGKSKLLAEKYIKKFSQKNWTILRSVSVYGPGDQDFLQLFKMIKKGFSVQIGFQKKYFQTIYISDLIQLIIRTFGNERCYQKTLFLANEPIFDEEDFTQIIANEMDKKIVKIRLPIFLISLIAILLDYFHIFSKRPAVLNRQKVKEFAQRYWLVDTSRTKEVLNFSHKSDVSQNIKKTIADYKIRGWL